MTLAPWLQRHPLFGYYALTFGISWSGIIVIVAASRFDLSPMQPLEGGLTSLTQSLIWQSVFALTLRGAAALVLRRPATPINRSFSRTDYPPDCEERQGRQ